MGRRTKGPRSVRRQATREAAQVLGWLRTLGLRFTAKVTIDDRAVQEKARYVLEYMSDASDIRRQVVLQQFVDELHQTRKGDKYAKRQRNRTRLLQSKQKPAPRPNPHFINTTGVRLRGPAIEYKVKPAAKLEQFRQAYAPKTELVLRELMTLPPEDRLGALEEIQQELGRHPEAASNPTIASVLAEVQSALAEVGVVDPLGIVLDPTYREEPPLSAIMAELEPAGAS
jgi:hypothetical protein